MKFKMMHHNVLVLDLEKSLAFYQKALGLVETRRTEAGDGSFILVFLSDGVTNYEFELTWMRDRVESYQLGDTEGEVHTAFQVEDFSAAYALHKEMGCICYENTNMGLYFIADPDGNWMEVIPKNR